jgi:hypothetical protein
MLLHMALLIVLAISLRMNTPQGAATERVAEVGIVLRHAEAGEEFFEGEEDGAETLHTTATDSPGGGAIDDLLSDTPAVDPATALPAAFARLGPGDLEGGGVGSAQGAADGPGRGPPAIGGQARTQVFGVEGEGYKFVYLFDRSGSMGGTGNSALAVAKAQLLQSLNSLGRNHQFQIIFYNHKNWVFNPTGEGNRLLFATDRNKELAARFVRGMTADGGTHHEDALLAAIALRPDVIFFLTDADEPRLWPSQLDRLRRRAAGVTIHAIEFGFGPQQNARNFLVQLAEQNGGQHTYIDVSRFTPAP